MRHPAIEILKMQKTVRRIKRPTNQAHSTRGEYVVGRPGPETSLGDDGQFVCMYATMFSDREAQHDEHEL